MLDFGRDSCGNLSVAREREWLITNGIGGYGMGTIPNMLTRRYHGLLVAALQPPLGRTLLLAKVDETVSYDGRSYSLSVNHWANDVIESEGTRHLERFHLEGTTPVWHFAVGDALLEKRIWMQPGANTTYIRYTLQRAGAGPLTFEAKALFNYRDYHQTTIVNDWHPHVEPIQHGVAVTMFDGARPIYLYSPEAAVTPQFDWYEDFYLSLEEYRGQPDVVEDHLYLAHCGGMLEPGQSLTLVVSTDPAPTLDGAAAYEARRAYEAALVARLPAADPVEQRLALAADQFIVSRKTPENGNGRSIIAGYPWFSDWGRDTMISLPGLTLATGRPEVTASILRTFAYFVDQGMLPNRFPDEGETPEYNTVDASLWYVEAVRAYHEATGDDALLRELFPVLEEIVDWYCQGTRYQIHLADDGLLYAGEPGIQLTWMDIKVGEWVVTPRHGKPVEINALWYNAISSMATFAQSLDRDPAPYRRLAEQARTGFERFWNEELGYCYDLLDGPDGCEATFRPNQLLAVSLPHSPLSTLQQRAVVDSCARQLLTSHGLRSLNDDHPEYVGIYGGDLKKRDAAYHQGTVWAWLIGPFVSAHLRIYGDKTVARSFLEPLVRHLAGHGVGSVSEIFDGDPPFTARGCPAQAWSVAELLRAWQLTAT